MIQLLRIDDNRRAKLYCVTCGAETYFDFFDLNVSPMLDTLRSRLIEIEVLHMGQCR